MSVKEYNITVPPNEEKLSIQLREQSLTGAVLELTVERINDDLFYRRNRDGVTPEKREFHVDSIDFERPTIIIGRVAVRGKIVGLGRIEATSSNDDDSQNKLKLTEIQL